MSNPLSSLLFPWLYVNNQGKAVKDNRNLVVCFPE